MMMALLDLFLRFIVTLEPKELTQATLLIILHEHGQLVAEHVITVLTVCRRQLSLVVTEDRVASVQVVEALLWQSTHREHFEKRVGALLLACATLGFHYALSSTEDHVRVNICRHALRPKVGQWQAVN